LSTLAFVLSSVAQEPVPYAYRPARQGEGYIPTLAAIMREIQFCHIKLSYEGQQSNWALANYEVAQIESNLNNAVQLYQNIPIEKIKLIDQPLIDLSQAIMAKDKVRFSRALTDMTNLATAAMRPQTSASFLFRSRPRRPLATNPSRQRKNALTPKGRKSSRNIFGATRARGPSFLRYRCFVNRSS
jgi:hypothetical protein